MLYAIIPTPLLHFLQVLEKDVDINMRDGDGATPLHFAASRGHTQMVRWLLRHGSKIVLDKYGKSPINDAAENERIEVGRIAEGHRPPVRN